MSNMICFNYKSDKDDLKDDLNMSNGGTSVFINVLCLSGGRLAALGIARINDAQKALLKNGGVDLVLAFGVRELPETADGVKVVRVKTAV